MRAPGVAKKKSALTVCAGGAAATLAPASIVAARLERAFACGALAGRIEMAKVTKMNESAGKTDRPDPLIVQTR